MDSSKSNEFPPSSLKINSFWKEKILYSSLFIISIFLICYFFPTNNSSADAWYYAAQIKWGKSNLDFFHPHHLLFNFFFKILCQIFDINNTFQFIKAFNAFLIVPILFLFRKILAYKGITHIFSFLLLFGGSYSLLRYACEAEVYLLPLFWMILGITLLTSPKKESQIFSFSAGFSFAMASLFHQTYIFLFLGFFLSRLFQIGLRTLKQDIAFYANILFIILVYFIVIQLCFGNFSYPIAKHFILHDLETGQINQTFDLKMVAISSINFFRSFFQIHGNILFFLKQNFLFSAIACISILLVCIGLFKMIIIKRKQILYPKDDLFFLMSAIIFFGFAIYNYGNAEFMVPIPLLILLYFSKSLQSISKPCLYLGTGILFWNVSISIVPNHIYSLNNYSFISQLIESKEDDIFILKERALVTDMLYYKNGYFPQNIYSLDKLNEFFNASDIKTNQDTSTIFCDGNGPIIQGSRLALTSDSNNIKKLESIYKFSLMHVNLSNHNAIVEHDIFILQKK